MLVWPGPVYRPVRVLRRLRFGSVVWLSPADVQQLVPAASRTWSTCQNNRCPISRRRTHSGSAAMAQNAPPRPFVTEGNPAAIVPRHIRAARRLEPREGAGRPFFPAERDRMMRTTAALAGQEARGRRDTESEPRVGSWSAVFPRPRQDHQRATPKRNDARGTGYASSSKRSNSSRRSGSDLSACRAASTRSAMHSTRFLTASRSYGQPRIGRLKADVATLRRESHGDASA